MIIELLYFAANLHLTVARADALWRCSN